MTTWATTNKASSPSWATTNKNLNEVTYFVSESGDFYLVGSAEADYLIAQDAISWATTNKS